MTSTSRRSCFDPRHGGGHCSGDDIVLLVVTAILVLAQLATSMYLTRRARRGLTAA
jgi:hypothetical protein